MYDSEEKMDGILECHLTTPNFCSVLVESRHVTLLLFAALILLPAS